MQMELHAVAVEFQFMDETARTRHLAAQCGKARLDEVGEWCGLRARQRTSKEAGGRTRTRALHDTGHADTISQDTLSKIIIIATHTFERRPH
jgi:hypothetical protein